MTSLEMKLAKMQQSHRQSQEVVRHDVKRRLLWNWWNFTRML